MRLIYGFGIRLLGVAMHLAALFNEKAKRWVQGRKNWQDQLRIPADRKVIWFHCASLGEFDQGLPIMHALKQHDPQIFLLVTFFSPSGMQHYQKRENQVDLAVYLPLDTKSNANKFAQLVKPSMVFFVKYEFWYNHLKAARRAGAKIYGVSSLFRPEHRFFKWYGGFFRKALCVFDHFFTQDERSKRLLASIGIDQATVSGDTRYDRMAALAAKKPVNEVIAQFKGEKPLLILGSSWPVDEELLLTNLAILQKSFQVLIAPHDVSENHIQQIEQNLNVPYQRYTSFDGQEEAFVLILDTIGQLSAAYSYASIAYVGGGFTGKLHNILEPGAFGVPVLFGPKYDRFPEASMFLEAGAALTIDSSDTFLRAIQTLWREHAQRSAYVQQIFAAHVGAAEKVLAALDNK
jgi:3-deoxy-D-manno-octulosonic-acid transferase